jgi:uncharacterized protein YlxW (UPF0749 family)
MITQKIKTMMSEVDKHISKKERLKAMSKIEDISEELNKVKQEQMTKQNRRKKYEFNINERRSIEKSSN